MEGPRKLNFQNQGPESWLYLFGQSLSKIDERVESGLDRQRARLRYMVSLSRRLCTADQYKEYRRVAAGDYEGTQDSKLEDLYDLIASLILRADREWTWQEEEVEELKVPGLVAKNGSS